MWSKARKISWLLEYQIGVSVKRKFGNNLCSQAQKIPYCIRSVILQPRYMSWRVK